MSEDFKMPSPLKEVNSRTSTHTALYDMMHDHMREACGLANAHLGIYGTSIICNEKVIDPKEFFKGE